MPLAEKKTFRAKEKMRITSIFSFPVLLSEAFFLSVIKILALSCKDLNGEMQRKIAEK